MAREREEGARSDGLGDGISRNLAFSADYLRRPDARGQELASLNFGREI